ncbi:hypothetical protein [Pseudofrankia inefficax]|uniref:Uncharacterized protein n=1 Tax=Pseudofrankia inefficax (strain DSM 45817 / CECT 9037 / DDB 130130 / EuI1c) TaxID=298654 RepID=E3JBA2_PSEI1|nr:hypothetical protein [Pseudofrankia inefficax]ADP78632.1 hypothetical protein FraEuI1c_0552 [Pseudofrankia inefficax]
MSGEHRPTTAPPVDDGFATWLRAALAAQALDIELPATAGSSLLARAGAGDDPRLRTAPAARSPRRRWVATAVVAAAVLLVTVGAATLPRALRGHGDQVVPASVPDMVAPTFYGVRVGWLPGEVQLYRDFLSAGIQIGGIATPGEAMNMESAEWATPAAIRARSDSGSAASGGYSLLVIRAVANGGNVPSVKADTSTEQTTTVRGHIAVWASSRSPGNAGGSLTWTVDFPAGTGGKATDHVFVQVLGPDETVVRRIADNLSVGPRPSGPTDKASAVAAMAASASAAFDGASGVAMADAVDDPQAVLDGIGAALRTRPDALHAVSFAGVGPAPAGSQPDPRMPQSVVVFLSDTEAQLSGVWIGGTTKEELAPATVPPNTTPPGMIDATIRFTLTSRGWKVGRASFCGALVGVVTCPTNP